LGKPLAGIRVLDLSRLFPGPYATLVLSDLGADVVKVEDPEPGDYLREISPGMFAALNRGKRSIVLDLKGGAGVAQLRRLCARADVLVESFRPGVLERLGFSDVLAEPGRLVVCRISGFGQTEGPWRERAGHDITKCPQTGLVVENVKSITINLNGHTIKGDYSGNQGSIGILIDTGKNITVKGPGTVQGFLDGMRAQYSTNVTFDGVTVLESGDDGIQFFNMTKGLARNNTVRHAWDAGISAYAEWNGTTKGIKIINNTVSDAHDELIEVAVFTPGEDTISGNVVQDNHVSKSDHDGILVQSTTKNTVSKNTVDGAAANGIHVTDGASRNLIENNTVTGSGSIDLREDATTCRNQWKDNDGRGNLSCID